MQRILGNLRGFVTVAIVTAVVIGITVSCDRLPGAAEDLQIGDCFDVPSETTEISEVQRQPCSNAHDAEVFLVFDHPAPAGEVYPISLSMDSFVIERCKPAFNTYTGLDFDNEPDLNFSAYIPTRDGWNDGDREITCYLLRSDDAKVVGSLRASAVTPSSSP